MESSYPGWSADTPDNSWWKTEIFDLQAYQGIANLMLRFRLKADSTVQEHGWHIDNVQVKESPQYDFSLDTPLDSYLLAGGSLDYTATIRNKGSQPDDLIPASVDLVAGLTRCIKWMAQPCCPQPSTFRPGLYINSSSACPIRVAEPAI